MKNNWRLEQHTRQILVNDKFIDVICLSHSNFESIAHQVLFSDIKDEAFNQFFITGNTLLDFFNIYYSVINESFLDDDEDYVNDRSLYPIAWKDKFGDEYYSFQDILLITLLRGFAEGKDKKTINKINQSLCKINLDEQLQGELHLSTVSAKNENKDKIHQAISEIITDKNIEKIAYKLLDNLIFYKKNNFSHINHFSKPKKEKEIKNNVTELFCLLRDSKEALIPYIKGSGLEKYFPNENDKQVIDGKLEYIIRFKKSNKWIQDFSMQNVFFNQKIRKFTTRQNVFYEVVGIGAESLVNQKTKLIFPIENDEKIWSNSENLLNPKFRNLIIFNHFGQNAKTEAINEPSEIYLDVDDLMKVALKTQEEEQDQAIKLEKIENMESSNEIFKADYSKWFSKDKINAITKEQAICLVIGLEPEFVEQYQSILNKCNPAELESKRNVEFSKYQGCEISGLTKPINWTNEDLFFWNSYTEINAVHHLNYLTDNLPNNILYTQGKFFDFADDLYNEGYFPCDELLQHLNRKGLRLEYKTDNKIYKIYKIYSQKPRWTIEEFVCLVCGAHPQSKELIIRFLNSQANNRFYIGKTTIGNDKYFIRLDDKTLNDRNDINFDLENYLKGYEIKNENGYEAKRLLEIITENTKVKPPQVLIDLVLGENSASDCNEEKNESHLESSNQTQKKLDSRDNSENKATPKKLPKPQLNKVIFKLIQNYPKYDKVEIWGILTLKIKEIKPNDNGEYCFSINEVEKYYFKSIQVTTENNEEVIRWKTKNSDSANGASLKKSQFCNKLFNNLTKKL